MTIAALVSGTIFRLSETKVSKADKPFVIDTLKCKDGDTIQEVLALSGATMIERQCLAG